MEILLDFHPSTVKQNFKEKDFSNCTLRWSTLIKASSAAQCDPRLYNLYILQSKWYNLIDKKNIWKCSKNSTVRKYSYWWIIISIKIPRSIHTPGSRTNHVALEKSLNSSGSQFFLLSYEEFSSPRFLLALKSYDSISMGKNISQSPGFWVWMMPNSQNFGSIWKWLNGSRLVLWQTQPSESQYPRDSLWAQNISLWRLFNNVYFYKVLRIQWNTTFWSTVLIWQKLPKYISHGPLSPICLHLS